MNEQILLMFFYAVIGFTFGFSEDFNITKARFWIVLVAIIAACVTSEHRGFREGKEAGYQLSQIVNERKQAEIFLKNQTLKAEVETPVAK